MFSFQLKQWMIDLVIVVIVGLAVGLGIHWFIKHEQQVGYDKAVAEYTLKQLVAEKAARAREAELTKRMEDAQNAANQREQALLALAKSSTIAAVSLRDTIAAIRNGLPQASAEAARKAADAFAAVFQDCTGKYRDMAEAADRHASDVKTLSDGWPK